MAFVRSFSNGPDTESMAFNSFDMRIVFCGFRRRYRAFDDASSAPSLPPLHEVDCESSSVDVFRQFFDCVSAHWRDDGVDDDFGDINSDDDDVGDVVLLIMDSIFVRSFMFGVILEVVEGGAGSDG